MLTAACILAFLPPGGSVALGQVLVLGGLKVDSTARPAPEEREIPLLACCAASFQWVARQVGAQRNREMASVREVEQATNRQRLVLVAGKAGLKPKHLKKIKAICAKYRDAPDETLSFDSSCPPCAGQQRELAKSRRGV
jgi:hypothetical protein